MLHVAQGVVHPPHVPLVGEAQAPFARRARDPGQAVDSSAIIIVPGKALATASLRWRRKSMASRFSRPPIAIGDPLPLAARVVAIQQRGDRIDAQPIDVKRSSQCSAPISGRSAPRAGRDCRPRYSIPGESLRADPHARRARCRRNTPAHADRSESARHPVEDHADAGVVAAIDEARERRGSPKSAVRRVLAQHLVAPGASERMPMIGSSSRCVKPSP
jgi:hypothetical protein